MSNKIGQKMRVYHRYLGFFLAGIMAVYALSGIVLIFRNTDSFKKTYIKEQTIDPSTQAKDLGKALDIRRLEVTDETKSTIEFKEGSFDKVTGKAVYQVKKLPLVLDKMTHLHKAKSGDKLFVLNIFFGLSLLFFVLSAFWMYLPSTDVFKKGMIFAVAGIVITLLLLFV